MRDNEKAIAYLRLLRRGVHNLVAIHPESGRIYGITRAHDSKDLPAFLDRYAGSHNIYYSVNEPLPDAPDTKLSKSHIKEARHLFIDADPDKRKPLGEERERLKRLSDAINADPIPPTFTIDSGGGYQSVWQLSEPIPFDAAENHGRGLAVKYGCDPVQNVDRILRLPYTLNVPDAKKAAAGRTPRLATVTHASKSVYPWESLKRIADPVQAPKGADEYEDFDASILTPDLHWRDVPAIENRFYALLGHNHKLRRLIFGDIKKPSRSECDFLIAEALKSEGWSLQDTAIALWLSPQGKGKDSTPRDIARAYARAVNPLEGMRLDDDAVAEYDKTVATYKAANKPSLELESQRCLYEKHNIPLPKRLAFNFNLSVQRTAQPLFKGLIDKESLIVTYGQSNVGKSFLALDQAAHLAAGKPWAGHRCPNRMGVVYVCAEAGRSFARRESAARRRLGIDGGAKFLDFPFITITMDVNFFEPPSDQRDDVGDVLKIVHAIEAEHGIKIGLIVVDTLATSFSGGNENSSEDMGKYISAMKTLQHAARAAVNVVHHSGKDQAAGARGHSSLRAATDTEFEVRSTVTGNGVKRELKVTKQREGETGRVIEFGLNVVSVGVDEDGDSIDTCHIALPGEAEFESVIPSRVEDMTENERAFYFAVYLANSVSGSGNDLAAVNGWYDTLKRRPINTDKEVQEFAKKVEQIPTPISARKMQNDRRGAERAANSLIAKGYIEKCGKGNWFII